MKVDIENLQAGDRLIPQPGYGPLLGGVVVEAKTPGEKSMFGCFMVETEIGFEDLMPYEYLDGQFRVIRTLAQGEK